MKSRLPVGALPPPLGPSCSGASVTGGCKSKPSLGWGALISRPGGGGGGSWAVHCSVSPALPGPLQPPHWFAPFGASWVLAWAGGDKEPRDHCQPPGSAHSPAASVPSACPCPLLAAPCSCLRVSLLCEEPIGISGFKKEKLFLSSSPSVISFLLEVRILHLAHQPQRSPNGV